jgi:hypothetical protein
MYAVKTLSTMYGVARQTIYKKLEDVRLREFVVDDDGKKLKPEGLETLRLVLEDTVKRKTKDIPEDNTLTSKLDEMTLKYITELQRQIDVLNNDKERLFYELKEQRKIFLLTSGEPSEKPFNVIQGVNTQQIKNKWWNFWNK